MKYCMNCRKQLPDDAKFCVDCGTPVKEERSTKRVEQAGTMNGVSSAPVPPPIPESKYYVAVNGQPTGPYTVASLREMMQNGQLTRLSLVWKDGMTGWSAVENVNDLKPILGAVIPPITTV